MKNPTLTTTGWLGVTDASRLLGWSRTKLHHANVNGEVPAWARAEFGGHTHYSALWCVGFKVPPAVIAGSTMPRIDSTEANIYAKSVRRLKGEIERMERAMAELAGVTP